MASTMSTFSRLPEELLDMILCEVLTLPSSSFLNWSDEYTYIGTAPSTVTDVLRVNKIWTRVGQRHLYEGVIIRRDKQAQKLVHTLVTHEKSRIGASPTLASRIRRLRIDRVQCKSVESLLKLATNVRVLHLNGRIHASVRGDTDWLAAFKCISPQIVYLQRGYCAENRFCNLFSEAFDSVLILADGRICESSLWSKTREVHIRKTDRSRDIERSFYREGVDPESARYSDCSLSGCSGQRRGLATLARASSLPDSVWGHILSFAMLERGLGERSELEGPDFHRQPRRRHYRRTHGFLLVSKRFKMLAEPLLYSEPFLFSDRAVNLFRNSLLRKPELARHVRILLLPYWLEALPWAWSLPNLRVSRGLAFATCSPEEGIIRHRAQPSLISLRMTCEACCRMVHRGNQGGPFCSDEDIFSHPALEELTICGCTLRPPLRAPLAHGLLRLKCLRLIQAQVDTIHHLSCMRLPALTALDVTCWDETYAAARTLQLFLSRHGHQLRHLVFGGRILAHYWQRPLLDFCPNLESFTIILPWDLKPELLECSRPHPHLKVLSFTDGCAQTECMHERKRWVEDFTHYLQAVDWTAFVALKEIILPDNICLPDCESAAADSTWPQTMAVIRTMNPAISVGHEGAPKYVRF